MIVHHTQTKGFQIQISEANKQALSAFREGIPECLIEARPELERISDRLSHPVPQTRERHPQFFQRGFQSLRKLSCVRLFALRMSSNKERPKLASCRKFFEEQRTGLASIENGVTNTAGILGQIDGCPCIERKLCNERA